MLITITRRTRIDEPAKSRHNRSFESKRSWSSTGGYNIHYICPKGVRAVYRYLTGVTTVPPNKMTFTVTKERHAGSKPITRVWSGIVNLGRGRRSVITPFEIDKAMRTEGFGDCGTYYVSVVA